MIERNVKHCSPYRNTPCTPQPLMYIQDNNIMFYNVISASKINTTSLSHSDPSGLIRLKSSVGRGLKCTPGNPESADLLCSTVSHSFTLRNPPPITPSSDRSCSRTDGRASSHTADWTSPCHRITHPHCYRWHR